MYLNEVIEKETWLNTDSGSIIASLCMMDQLVHRQGLNWIKYKKLLDVGRFKMRSPKKIVYEAASLPQSHPTRIVFKIFVEN